MTNAYAKVARIRYENDQWVVLIGWYAAEDAEGKPTQFTQADCLYADSEKAARKVAKSHYPGIEFEATPGRAPHLYEKTDLTLNGIAYELCDLKEPDGHVPTGWAVLYKRDGVYVAWGLNGRKQAHDIAVGHELGMRFFGSKL